MNKKRFSKDYRRNRYKNDNYKYKRKRYLKKYPINNNFHFLKLFFLYL